jgi:DNA-binding transcriptional ArsR family regulator
MVEYQTSSSSLDQVFRALGDATRRGMLASLASGERSVGQLAEPFDMSLAAASKHLKVLESAGLVRREVQGRTHVCRLEAGPLSDANAWLQHYAQFWTARLDRLEQLLLDEAAGGTAGADGANKVNAASSARRPGGTRAAAQRKPTRPAPASGRTKSKSSRNSSTSTRSKR